MASPLALLRVHPPLHRVPFPSPSTVLFPARRLSLLPVYSSPPLTLSDPSSYGPSLRKGLSLPLPPSPVGTDPDDACRPPAEVDRQRFTRIFDLAALRVPAARCASLEARLRGHLLNWPRLRNVARVPGDEVDPEVAGLLRPAGGEDRLAPSLRRARGEEESGEEDEEALSPVLYREKLVKEFNCRGFVRFRNLAKMSRPRKKKKKKRGKDEGEEEEKDEGEGTDAKRRGKEYFSVVEVVGVCDGEGKEDKEDGLRGLLGDCFMEGRWRGSTRLLLLDERYANRAVEELPEAVKVA